MPQGVISLSPPAVALKPVGEPGTTQASGTTVSQLLTGPTQPSEPLQEQESFPLSVG